MDSVLQLLKSVPAFWGEEELTQATHWAAAPHGYE